MPDRRTGKASTWHYAVDDYGCGARAYRKVIGVEPGPATRSLTRGGEVLAITEDFTPIRTDLGAAAREIGFARAIAPPVVFIEASRSSISRALHVLDKPEYERTKGFLSKVVRPTAVHRDPTAHPRSPPTPPPSPSDKERPCLPTSPDVA
ncbi:hypothetical protein [Streptomyces sp. NPDC048252]|uniref:hypothetical protein n=1 Tax=Streptomyces sp. NPDC048252 TaxID=3154612 RepID=UPI0034136272